MVTVAYELDWLLFNGIQGSWLFIYIPLALLVGILALRQLRRLWRFYPRVPTLAMAGTLLLFAGVAGLEATY